MSDVHPATPPGSPPAQAAEPPLTAADMLAHEAAAREQHQHRVVHDRAACGLCPPAQAAVTPGQAAYAVMHRASGVDVPHEDLGDDDKRLWDDIAQAVLNDAFPGLKRERDDAFADREHLRADRDAVIQRAAGYLERLAELTRQRATATVAPELAAALAETRAVRDGYAALCREFGPSAQSGWSARISLTILNRHRAAAGLDRFTRTESNDREDILLRYRRERDEAREQAEQMELERNEARHQRDACRENNAAIAVQSDQYRDERDDALAAVETLAIERDTARDALGKILRGLSSGEGIPLDDDEIIAIARGVLGTP